MKQKMYNAAQLNTYSNITNYNCLFITLQKTSYKKEY